MASAARQEIVGIQYLRAIAVLLVVFDHVEGIFEKPKYFGEYFAGGFLTGGGVGVDLFFVISGFIIVYVTNGLDGRTDARQFAWSRFSRIIPFMWLCVLLHFALRSLARGPVEAEPYWVALSLFPVGEVDPKQIWSLRHEAMFYLFVGLALAWRWGRSALLAFLVSPIVLALLWPDWGAATEQDFWPTLLNPRANTCFALGVLAAYWHRRGLPACFTSRLGLWMLALSPLVLLVLAWFLRGVVANDPWRVILVSALCFAIVVGSLRIDPSRAWWARLMLHLGAASYAIYLTHDSVISAVAGFASRLLPGSGILVAAAIAAIGAIVVGSAMHLQVERRMVVWLRDRPGRRLSSRA